MHEFLGKKILIITAHPDDESFTAAGTIAKNAQLGGETAVACATLGEQGKSHLEEEVDEEILKNIRRKELETVSEFLGVHALFAFEFPDTKLAEHKDAFKKECAAIIEDFKPDTIMSFGKDGMSGHRDHVAAYETAYDLAAVYKKPLYVFTLPSSLVEQIGESMRNRRAHGVYHDELIYPDPDVVVEVDPQFKLAALRRHVSQIDGDDPYSGFPESSKDELASKEFFAHIL